MKSAYFLLLLALLSLPVQAGLFDNFFSDELSGYECAISVKEEMQDNSDCAEHLNRVHYCQIKGTYEGGTPLYCTQFCLRRSEIPKGCAQVIVQESSFFEKGDLHPGEDGSDDSYVPMTDEEVDDLEEELFGDDPLYGMQAGDVKIVDDEDGDYAILIAPNGAISYTVDGAHYAPTLEQARNPGVFTGISRGFSSFMSNLFNKRKGSEGNMQVIADAMLDEVKGSQDTKASALQLAAGSAAGSAVKATTLAGPAALGISMPASSISLIAKGGKREAFSQNIIDYIKQREDTFSNSPQEARDLVLVDPLVLGAFDSQGAAYDAMELAYQRYCLREKIEGRSCRTTS